MAKREIDNLLNDEKAFFAAFPDIKSFSEYHDENGDNLFHIVQKQSSPSFVKSVYDHYMEMAEAKETEKEKNDARSIINAMLIERNRNGRIPANFDFPYGHLNPDDYKPTSAENKRRYENYRLLKRYTKKAYYPLYMRDAHSPDKNTFNDNPLYYKPGTAYANGISNAVAIGNGENALSMQTPCYPTIRLVIHDSGEKVTTEGFSKDKKRKTQYINWRYNAEETPEKKKIFSRIFPRKNEQKINQGEMLIIESLPITDAPLSKQIKDVLLFPEDYAFAAKTMDTVGAEIKMYHGSEIMEPLIRYFKKNGGAIQIENTELKHLNSNGKSSYYSGLNTALSVRDPDGIPYLTSIVSMNAKYDYYHAYRFSTTEHEVTHHNDQGFSQSRLMDYMIAVYCANPDLDSILFGNLKNIADGYKKGHFNEEALANLVSQYHKDEFTAKAANIFARFVEAKANSDTETSQFVILQSHSDKYIRNRKLLDAMVADFKQADTSSKKMDDYHNRYAGAPEIKDVVRDFMHDMDNIILTIDKNKQKSRFNIEQYNKRITVYSENEINRAFWETSEKLDDSPSLGDKYRLLTKQYGKTIFSGRNRLETFKLALIMANIEKSLNIPVSIAKDESYDPKDPNSRMMPDASDYDFSTPDSFEYIQRVVTPRQLTGIVRNANRLRTAIAQAQTVPNAGPLDIKIAMQTSISVADIRSSIDRAERDADGKSDIEVSKMLTALVNADAQESDPQKRLDLLLRTLATAGELYKRKGQNVPPAMDMKERNFDALLKSNIRLCRDQSFIREMTALQRQPDPKNDHSWQKRIVYAQQARNGDR